MARILIVDDESSLRNLMAMTFLNAGFEVETAQNGAEAIELFAKSEPFDALLSDVVMPLVNGHELVRLTMEAHPGIRCVLMTGFDDTECDECPFANRCYVLEKPFHPADAVHLVERLLKEAGRKSGAGGAGAGAGG
jgi:DNA-binding NtrC family response regulator